MRVRIKDFIVNLPLRMWVRLVRLLPYRTKVILGGWFMRRVAVGFTDYEERIVSNLNLVRPNDSDMRKTEIVKGCLDNCGRMFAEYYAGSRFLRQAGEAELTGPGLLQLREAHLAGRSVVFASGHFGNFEAGRAALIHQVRKWQRGGCKSRSAQRIGMIEKEWIIGGLYRPTNNAAFEEHHLASFTSIGQPAFPKGTKGLRDLMAYLRSSGWVMILHDQHDPHGIPLNFMGAEAMTSVTAARLALRFDALLIPYYCIRKSDGLDFEVAVEEPVASGTAEEMTRQLTASLEAMVKKHPEQWFWVHRRWRI